MEELQKKIEELQSQIAALNEQLASKESLISYLVTSKNELEAVNKVMKANVEALLTAIKNIAHVIA